MIVIKAKKICRFLVLIALILFVPAQVLASDSEIETLSVVIECSDNAPSARIVRRMEASINTVGQHVLVGKKVTEIEEGRASYEKLIQEVFDRVLVGYSVNQVDILPDTETIIKVKLEPWGDVVHRVSLQIDFSGISPEITQYIKKDLGNVEEQVANVLIGLPVDAVDWAGSVSKSVIRQIIAQKLPEFQPSFDIISGPDTVIKLALVPIGQTVKDINVSLRSDTVPNILLLKAKPHVLQAAKAMQGLPVSFIEKHKDELTAKFKETPAVQQAAKQYGLGVTANIEPGTDTAVTIDAETTKYRINLEGYLDIARKENNTSAKLHAGKFLGEEDEVFMEVTFSPSTVKWEFIPGWAHKLSEKTTAGYKHNWSSDKDILFVKQELGKNWTIRIERYPASKENEVGLRYKLHEFLSAEYICTDEEKYLRLVGHL